MTSEKKREWTFMALVILVGVFVLVKTVRLSLEDGDIAMTITQNKEGIQTIDTRRDASVTQTMQLQRIDFPQTRLLENDQYGKLGFSSNFFLDFDVAMQVAKAGTYYFMVSSDDGFRLKIDGKSVCEHPGDRPMQETGCRVVLEQGRHLFALNYFQGGGPMGLQVTYREAGGGKARYVGEDSDAITFEKRAQ